jgi:branched-chain amino acid transport system permease protein
MELLASITANLILYTLLLLSLNNFIIGKTSILPVGHLAFFGIGAIVTGILVADWNISPWGALAIVIVLGLLVSLIVGLATMRLAGDYFIILSIALCEIVRSATISIRGPAGITGIARPKLFSISLENTWVFNVCVLLPILILLVLVAQRFKNSPLERICILIQQNEVMAKLQGIRVLYYKVGCFCIGSVIATLVGALYTLYSQSTDPSVITIYQSILLFAMVLFGGINSIRGSIIGGMMLVLAPRILEFLINRPTSSYYSAQIIQLLYGTLLIIIIRFMPQGIMGTSKDWFYTEEL